MRQHTTQLAAFGRLRLLVSQLVIPLPYSRCSALTLSLICAELIPQPALAVMAGGGLAVTNVGGRSAEYNGKVTWYVVCVALIAASGGLLFGYDLGEYPVHVVCWWLP